MNLLLPMISLSYSFYKRSLGLKVITKSFKRILFFEIVCSY